MLRPMRFSRLHLVAPSVIRHNGDSTEFLGLGNVLTRTLRCQCQPLCQTGVPKVTGSSPSCLPANRRCLSIKCTTAGNLFNKPARVSHGWRHFCASSAYRHGNPVFYRSAGLPLGSSLPSISGRRPTAQTTQCIRLYCDQQKPDDLPDEDPPKAEGSVIHYPGQGVGAVAALTVPDVWPQVPVIAVSRNPVFPRFIKMVEVGCGTLSSSRFILCVKSVGLLSPSSCRI